MKTFCAKHGCHFKQDFKQTLRCGYWASVGLEKLSVKNKKIVWDWMFALPVDSIFIEDKIMVNTQITGSAVASNQNQFAQDVPNYNAWDENKQQMFQKEFFKFINSLDRDTQMRLLTHVFLETRKKWQK